MRRNFTYLLSTFVFSFLYATAAIFSIYASANNVFIEADLQRQFPDTERVQLSADSTFMALSRPRMTGYQKGTVVLIADINEHAASPKYINYLRLNLTELGWNTLSIMPPAIASFDPSSIDSYQQQLQQRTAAAITYASREPGAIVIIAQGSSAAIINQLYAEQQLPNVMALIIVGAYLPELALNKQLAEAIAAHTIPVLDINNSLDNRFVLTQLKQRQQLVKKNFKAIYRQRLITGSGYDASSQDWVLQEIYGWLVSIGL